MQNTIHVVEDVQLGDRRIIVVRRELLQTPIRDVVAAVGAVFVVDGEGEALEGRAATIH